MVLPTVAVIQSPNSSVTCIAPIGWVPYRVLPGETLFEIAQATGTTVGVLRAANCLTDANLIVAGSTIYVPRPVTAGVPTVAPVFPTEAQVGTDVVPLQPEGCLVTNVSISSPVTGDEVTGTFDLVGNAFALGFRYYELKVRPEGSEVYDFYLRRSDQVVGGVLAPINTDLFEDGQHWIQVSVVDRNGTVLAPCAIPLIFR